MAGPQDFMVGNAPAPASYASGLMDFAAIGKLGEQYLKGRAANAFAGGIPTLPNGQPNVPELLNIVAQTGGTPAVTALLPYLYMYGDQGGAPDMTGNTGPGERAAPGAGAPAPVPQPVSQAGNYHPAGTSPDNIVPRQQPPQRQEPPQQVMPHITGAGTAEDPAVIPGNSTAFQHFRESQYFPNGTVYQITTPSGTYRGVKGDDSKLTPVAPQVVPKSGETSEAAAKRTLGERMGAAAAPPVETAVPPRIVQQPAPPPRAPPADPAVNDPVILDHERRRQNLENLAAHQPKTPLGNNRAEALMAEAKAQGDAAKSRAEYLRKQAEQTPEQKNIERGIEQKKAEIETKATGERELQKKEIDRGELLYGAFNAASTQYLQNKDLYDQAIGLANDPAFYSGFGGKASMNWNSFRTMMGGDPKAAMLQNAFQKVTAGVLLNTLNQQKDQMGEAASGSQAGRIFAQQMEIAKEASPGLENTVAGNRFLLTMAQRSGEQSVALAEMARQFRADPKHPFLNKDFDAMASKYLQDHPIITKQEINHPELMGAPRVPSDILEANGGKGDKAALIRWGQAHRLRPPEPGADRDPKKFQGDPIRLGNKPEYIHMPPITFPSLGEGGGRQ